MQNISLGKLGERIAANYLTSQGYKIIEMNFRKRWGEIDVVALDKSTLVFVEVKTRMESDRITPEESITPKKVASLKSTAIFYKNSHPKLPETLRIDFVGIVLDRNLKPVKINLIKSIS